jgi:hypothetical protein
MSNQNFTVKDLPALAARLAEEITPASLELDKASREAILSRAQAEGWPKEQAIWLDRLAKQPLFQAVADGVPGPEALDKAYSAALRELTSYYFDAAIEEGKNPIAAFLTVVNLEKALAERRGETLEYPERILMLACKGVTEAAEQGLSSKEQIDVGYAIIRRLGSDPAFH